MTPTARAGPSRQKPEVWNSPTWMAEPQVLGLSSTPFPGITAGNWIGSRASRTGLKLDLVLDISIIASGLAHCTTMLAPNEYEFNEGIQLQTK